MQSTEKSKAILLVESQPPHLGELLQFIQQQAQYEQVYVCIYGDTTVMALDHVYAIWNNLLAPYKGQTEILLFRNNIMESAKEDFAGMFEDCVWLTCDKAIYVHLNTLKVSVEFIPRALGYRGTFLRVAFRQSKALDFLEARYGNKR